MNSTEKVPELSTNFAGIARKHDTRDIKPNFRLHYWRFLNAYSSFFKSKKKMM